LFEHFTPATAEFPSLDQMGHAHQRPQQSNVSMRTELAFLVEMDHAGKPRKGQKHTAYKKNSKRTFDEPWQFPGKAPSLKTELHGTNHVFFFHAGKNRTNMFCESAESKDHT
jgi:hypothetical protein